MKRIGVIAGIFLFGIIFYLFSSSEEEKYEVIEPEEVSVNFIQNGDSVISKNVAECFESEGCNSEEVTQQRVDLEGQTEGMKAVRVNEGGPITVETKGAEPSGIKIIVHEVVEHGGATTEARSVENHTFELHGEGEKHVRVTVVWRKKEQEDEVQATISRVMKVDVRE